MGCELNMQTQLTRRAVFDGLIRTAALLVLIDYATSTYYIALGMPYSEELLAIVCIPAVIAFVLSAVLAVSSFKKYRSEFKAVKYIIISAVTFILTLFVFELLNNPVLHLRLFTIRELSNADGMVIILIYAVFLISGIIGRIAAITVIWIKTKSN